jgi:hypothetical protein
MPLKLSHSQCSKYTQCPQAYKYHYIERIRPKLTPASLLFGSALDAALNELLKPEQNKTPEEIFIDKFTTADINGTSTDLPSCVRLTYAASDLDLDLLDLSEEEEESIMLLKSKKSKYGLDGLSYDEHMEYNKACWLSLKEKGLLMLQAYRTKVLPSIKKVLDVQIEISLSNGEDSVTGFVDLVADIEGHGTVILDNKTSSIEYAEDSVITSPQLSLYMHALHGQYKTRKAGYIVLRKQIKKNRVKICSKCGHDGSSTRHATCANTIEGKRCGGQWDETTSPDVDVQIIIDEIPERTEDIVLDNYDSVTHAIKAGVFPRNLQSCKNVYGGPCPYFNLCYKNLNTGLEKV